LDLTASIVKVEEMNKAIKSHRGESKKVISPRRKVSPRKEELK
jgi:hypothetical protein